MAHSTAEPPAHLIPAAPTLRLPRVELAWVWLAAPPCLAAFVGGFLPLEAVDPWWSLVLGTAPSGASDPIVFTPLVGPAANVQWLAHRALAGLHAAGGVGALLALRSIILALSLALLQLLVLQTGHPASRAALAATLALPTVIAGAAVRPQLFAIPLFVAILLLGGPRADRRRTPLALAAAVALWANVHGSFVLAPIALLVLAAAGPWRLAALRLRLAGIALAAALLDPWAAGVYSAAVQVAQANGTGTSSLALEWRPLDPLSLPGLFFLLQAGAAIVAILRLRRACPLEWLVLAIPLALLALTGGRHTLWFALAIGPLAAGALSSPAARPAAYSTATSLVVAALLLLGVVGVLRPLGDGAQQLAPETPIEAADRLTMTDARRVFAFSDWGGYLAWRLRPDGRVYVDDRFEQHSADLWARYRSISRAEPGWERLLDEADVDALALEVRQQGPLVAAADRSPAWRPVHRDERSAVFVRR